MTSVRFGLSSVNDFIEKLKREIWRLHDAQCFDETDEHILDHGLNAAITAWHLHEMVAKEHQLNLKNYRDDIKRRMPELGLIHDIATQAKHFQVTSPKRTNPESTLEMQTKVRPFMTEEEWLESRQALSGFGISVKGNDVYKYSPYRALIIEGKDVEEILTEIRFFLGA